MTEILDIAKQHLRRVKRSGPEDIMAICPFHQKAGGGDEKHPSFSMNVYSGLWYCHSCHVRGNLYTFLRDIGMPRADIEFLYKSALEEAEKHAPPKADPLNPQEAVNAEPLDESFLGLFDYCPQKLLDEGYPEELLRKFDIGFDQKHQRITFPLRDMRGRLVGISGRSVVDDVAPRYKVYDVEYKAFGLPERKTEKRRLVWNAHNVMAQFAFEKNPNEHFVVVTEGFKSVMRVTQAGAMNVVGLMGSYLADEQKWFLERLGCPVLLMLDNNSAGRRGQLDAGKRLVRDIPRLFVVDYPGDQPSETPITAIADALSDAQPFASWLIKQHIHL